MTTGEWKSGGAYHRSLSATAGTMAAGTAAACTVAAGTPAAGTAAAGTAAAIKVAPLGAAWEGVSGSAKPLCSRALQEIQA
jgi:hypothetical protein